MENDILIAARIALFLYFLVAAALIGLVAVLWYQEKHKDD